MTQCASIHYLSEYLFIHPPTPVKIKRDKPLTQKSSNLFLFVFSSFFEKYCFGFVNFTLVGQWKRIFDKFLYWKRTAEYLNLIQCSLILLLFQSLFTLLLFLKFLNRLPLRQCVFGQQMHIIMEWNNLECVFIISAFVEPIFGKPVCLSVVFSRHLFSKMETKRESDPHHIIVGTSWHWPYFPLISSSAAVILQTQTRYTCRFTTFVTVSLI